MTAPTESACLWKPPLFGLELFEATLFSQQFGKHFHAAYTIGVNEEGLGCCLLRGDNQHHYPGSLKLLNPGEVHTGQAVSADTGWSFRNIYIDVTAVERALAQFDYARPGLPYFKEAIVWDPALRSRFYELFQALTAPPSPLQQQSLLLELLAQIFLRGDTSWVDFHIPGAESKAVAVVRAYLEAHYAERVTLDELAQLVNLSPYYLIRSFRQQVGCPPYQYQQQWQLLRAKQALQTPDAIAAIAIAHGFYDQSHLTRAFKQAFGVTPGQYQKVNSVQDR